jgi:hypothetical protein
VFCLVLLGKGAFWESGRERCEPGKHGLATHIKGLHAEIDTLPVCVKIARFASIIHFVGKYNWLAEES